jgi:hypothetical protein
MTLRHLGTRIRLSLIAVVAGWAAAMVATLPMQFAKTVANTFGGPEVLLLSLVEGTIIWGLWGLAIAAGGWLFGLIPVILVVPEVWLVKHIRGTLTLAAILSWMVVLDKFEVWQLLLPNNTLALRLFTLYSLMLVIYATVSVAVYLRLIAPKTGNSSSAA